MSTVGIVSKPSRHFVECVLECFEQGHAVVLLRSADDRSRIEQAGVTRIVEPRVEHGWIAGPRPPRRDDDTLAQIAFTSGTEGEPKGVELTHRALADVVDRLNDVMEVDSDIREYVGVPVHYSFGFGRCRAVLAAGGAAYIPENGFNPAQVKAMLSSGEINAISAVPSLWRILLRGKGIFGAETGRVRWIEIGSQYMSRREKEELKALFPNAKIAQHYGLTEASRSTFLRVDLESGDRLESVGRAHGRTEIAIGPSGRIRIRGPHVARQLLKSGRRVDNVDADGWFETQDLGRLVDGYLHFLGRADDQINCGGVKLSPDALDEDLRRALGVKEGLAVAAVPHDLAGHAILVAFTKASGLRHERVEAAALESLARYGLHGGSAVRFACVESLPLTDTGKVRRQALAAAYTDGAAPDPAVPDRAATAARAGGAGAVGAASPDAFADSGAGDTEAEIQAIWRDVLGIRHVDVTKNFYDHGGDSLTALIAVMELERRKVPEIVSKGMLQGLNIREISGLIGGESSREGGHRLISPELKSAMSINAVRGVLVLCVILAHWSGGIVARMPQGVGTVAHYLAPLMSIGTPGFAIIYGVSAGYAMFPIFNADRSRFRRITSRTFVFLSGGIVVSGLANVAARVATGQSVTFTDFTNQFYSVLTYYWLMTLTLGLWFRWLAARTNPGVWAALAGVVCLSLHRFVFEGVGAYRTEGLVEFAKLLISAKYAYFNLASGTLIGIAGGIYLRQRARSALPVDTFLPIGIAAILAGLLVSSRVGPSANWFVPVATNPIWRWMFYCGVVLVLVHGAERLLVRYNEASAFRRIAMQALAVFGMLAFPLFVTHGLVIPLKDILHGFTGLRESVALAVSMGLFVATTWFMYRKVHQANFGRFGAAAPRAPVGSARSPAT